MVAGALFWGALLGEIARYAQATSRELKSLADARANPGQVLQRLSGLAQQYLASLATLPARLETGDGLAARGAGRSPRRQGRIIN
jgi:hypothetical protein